MRRHRYALALLFACAGCREAVIHDLDEASANRVQLSLLNAGVVAAKTRSGERWSIEVGSDDLIAALEIVEASRVVRRHATAPLPAPSMLMSREERAELLLRNRALLIERTIEGLPEVLEARVHVGGGARESASVVAVVGRELPQTVEEIRALTAASLGVAPQLINVLVRTESRRPGVRTPPRAERYPVLFAAAGVTVMLFAALRARTRSRRQPVVEVEMGEVSDVF